jgi:lysophospholipase
MTLISLAKNPVPGGATSGFVTTSDGTKLRYAIWDPTRSPLRGTCVVVQGRSEFIEKYFETVADLRRRGYAVATFDLRGQGGSDRALANPAKGHVRNFKDYDLDLDTVMREIVLERLPAPYIGLGHSLGGHILLRAALHAGGPFERMVLTGAMIRIADAQFGLARGVARGVIEAMCLAGASTAFIPGGSAPPAVAGPFETNVLTSDRERFMRARAVLEAAPQLAIGSPTAGWMRAALRAMAQLQMPDTPKAVAVPVLFVAAGDDKIVSTTAIEEFALRTKLGSRVLIATSRHEILQETDDTRSRFWAAFDAYLSEAAVAA